MLIIITQNVIDWKCLIKYTYTYKPLSLCLVPKLIWNQKKCSVKFSTARKISKRHNKVEEFQSQLKYFRCGA